MPMILPHLENHTGGSFELIVLENDLFGPGSRRRTLTRRGVSRGASV